MLDAACPVSISNIKKIQPRKPDKQYKMNLTVPVGKEGASAARWKDVFWGMAQEIFEKDIAIIKDSIR